MKKPIVFVKYEDAIKKKIKKFFIKKKFGLKEKVFEKFFWFLFVEREREFLGLGSFIYFY